MYGNPGDYAWGRGGLDVIVTQLLNQMDGTGPPPLKGETIEKIPKVKVTQEHVGKMVVNQLLLVYFLVLVWWWEYWETRYSTG